jgi:hypothetical protein
MCNGRKKFLTEFITILIGPKAHLMPVGHFSSDVLRRAGVAERGVFAISFIREVNAAL